MALFDYRLQLIPLLCQFPSDTSSYPVPPPHIDINAPPRCALQGPQNLSNSVGFRIRLSDKLLSELFQLKAEEKIPPRNQLLRLQKDFLYSHLPQVVAILTALPPQGQLPVSILPTQSLTLIVGEESWGIEHIIPVAFKPADGATWVNLLQLRTCQEGIFNNLRRCKPWLNDFAFGVTGSIQVLWQVWERVTQVQAALIQQGVGIQQSRQGAVAQSQFTVRVQQ